MKSLAVVSLFTFAIFAHADDKKPTDPLQGEWKAVAYTYFGMEQPQDKLADMQLVIKDNIMTMKFPKATDKKWDITIALDPKEKPATIDLTLVEGGKELTVPGIYKVEKDKLTICYEQNPLGHRPKEFKSEDDGGRTVLMVLERVKK